MSQKLKRGNDGLFALIANNVPSYNNNIDMFRKKFNEYGHVANVKIYNSFVFVRYPLLDDAENCLRSLKNDPEFRVKIAKNNRSQSCERGRASQHKFMDRSSDECSDFDARSTKSAKSTKSTRSLKSGKFSHRQPIDSFTSCDSDLNNSFSDEWESGLNNLQLGHRTDGNSHLFISNLQPNTSVEDIKDLLSEYHIIRMTDILRTLPEQPLRVYYVMVTLSMQEAKAASAKLNGKYLLGSQLMALEVQDMYRRAVMPCPSSNVKPPLTLKEIYLELEKRV